MSASLTHLIPSGELAPGQAAAIRNAAIDGVLAIVMKELKMPLTQLVVRDISPDNDLDWSTEDWFENTGSTTGDYETMTTGTMADQRWVVIFGVKDDPTSPGNCSALKFNIGGSNRAIWQLQHLNELDGLVGFSPNPVVIPPNAPYTISRYVLRASVASHLVLKGVTIEPRGKLISP